jgi:hypothetical protein
MGKVSGLTCLVIPFFQLQHRRIRFHLSKKDDSVRCIRTMEDQAETKKQKSKGT